MLEKIFSSKLRERLKKYSGLEAQSFKDTMIGDMDFTKKYVFETILNEKVIKKRVKEKLLSGKENSSSETPCSKSVKESSFKFETKNMHAINYKMSKAKGRCMTYFRSLYSHLQVLSKEDLKALVSNMDSNGHFCHSLVKITRLSQGRYSSTRINYKINLTKMNSKNVE
ncbi:hypothetical protein Tco_1074972 [Tanacetum coccineum]